jgi:hypothetical protein
VTAYDDDLLDYLTPDERAELDALVDADLREVIWSPLPGPQTMAYHSKADVIGYGGAAGGGKTDLACGKALTHHRQVAIFRREATQLGGIIDRMADLLGGRDGFNGQEKVWRGAGPNQAQVVFGSVPNLGDERKHQGRAKDLLVIDEAANFLEAQVRFLAGWIRTTDPEIHPQMLMTFNPPTDAEGRWVVSYFAPWLDKKHPLYPAAPGRLIWVTTVAGKDDWSHPHDPRPFVMAGDQRVYEFDPKRYKPEEIIRPKSRTFIPSRISDNPYLMSTGYMTTLQSMPEPLRSQMLNGDFEAGMEDGAFQLYPTEWVEAAMARWKPLSPKPDMDSLGVDVARGGRDKTMLAPRHGHWYDKIKEHPGTTTPDGPTVAGLAIGATRNGAVIHLDVIGVGASPYDFLVQANQDVIGVNVSEASNARDMSGRLGFFNLRSQLGWQFREMLDPANDTGIALPPDSELLADLCAYSWRLRGSDIYVESREEIVKRIGRSPDRASAVILASMDTPKRRDTLAKLNARHTHHSAGYDPLQHLAGTHDTHRGTYDPYA